MLQKLYVRIWLAVVLAVAVLTFMAGVVWRMAAEPPLREVVVRNIQGDVIGSGSAHMMRPGEPLHDEAQERREHDAEANSRSTASRSGGRAALGRW